MGESGHLRKGLKCQASMSGVGQRGCGRLGSLSFLAEGNGRVGWGGEVMTGRKADRRLSTTRPCGGLLAAFLTEHRASSVGNFKLGLFRFCTLGFIVYSFADLSQPLT